eukprot:6202880-Pleurochrysis_carterae.AAC.4
MPSSTCTLAPLSATLLPTTAPADATSVPDNTKSPPPCCACKSASSEARRVRRKPGGFAKQKVRAVRSSARDQARAHA